MKDDKMYLSCLTIHVGNDPTREQPGRKWLRNLYHVHQRLCMAFPSKEKDDEGKTKQERDPDFLAPYDPEDFPEHRYLADRKKTEVDPDVLKQVHRPRDGKSGFLFRIDPEERCCANGAGPSPSRVVILVQSAAPPDWEYAFHNAGYLLAAPPEMKPFDPSFEAGQRLRFCLVANPTRRLSKRSLGADGRPIERGVGKRVPVPADRLLDWLADWRIPPGREGDTPGFSIDKQHTTVTPGYVYWNRERNSKGNRLFSVRYDGILEVTEGDKFSSTLVRGIGPGKAFGFGLLSVAPVRL